ncbi:MAG: DUF4838 domain-containing protein [Victivallales bacterium]|nr:DUF4838 domain-containing protein [Victivallales bacterium]
MKTTFAALLLALAVTLAAATPQKIIFSQDGKCRYSLVLPEELPKLDQAAVEDLRVYLQKISGAELPIGNQDAACRIFYGKQPPEDERDYSQSQRSVTTVGNDIYIFGGGADGSAFAVYDFLEALGCRWYNAYGGESIPVCRLSQYDFPTPQLYLNPSYKMVELGCEAIKFYPDQKNNPHVDFLRRNRCYISNLHQAYKLVGSFCHTFAVFVPPTGVPAPFPLCWPVEPLKELKYFETNPEFFSMDKKGQRVPNMQLCFSNRELRRTLTENIEKVIQYNHLENEPIVIPIDCNDTAKFCYCPDCLKYEEMYATNAGAHYDYLLEVAPYFQQKYPKAIIRFLSGYDSAVAKLPDGKKLPSNVYPFHAFLGHVDRTKPITHSQNRQFAESIDRVVASSDKLWVYNYPDQWAIPSNYYHLYPNLKRLLEEIRYYHQKGGKLLFISGPDLCSMLFIEMKHWLALKCAQDTNADCDALTNEYINANYGAAAPLVRQFYQEVEAAELATERVIGWDSSHLVDKEITGEMMRHWDDLFDQMEACVIHDVKAREAICLLRWVLDYNIATRWDDFLAANPDKAGELPNYHNRCKRQLLESFAIKYHGADKAKYGSKAWAAIRALDEYTLVHYPPHKPLPKELENVDASRIHRVLPYISNSIRLTQDEDAAFGVAAVGEMRKRPFMFGMKLRNPDLCNYNANCKQNFTQPDWETIQNAPAGYNLYHLGDTALTHDCELTDICSPAKRYCSATFGQYFDPAHPDARYDVYVSMKFANDKIYTDQVILVRKGD